MRSFLALLLCITPAMAETLEGHIEETEGVVQIQQPVETLPPTAPHLPAYIQQYEQSKRQARIDRTQFNAHTNITTPNFIPQQPTNDYYSPSNTNSRKFNQLANHGAIVTGVVGFTIHATTNRVLRIYPGSELLDLGIRPGDLIVAVEGRPYTIEWLHQVREGAPGTTMEFTLYINGQYVTVHPHRKDSRIFAPYSMGSNEDHYFAEQIAKERFW